MMGRYDKPKVFTQSLIGHARGRLRLRSSDVDSFLVQRGLMKHNFNDFICLFCKQHLVIGELVYRHHNYPPYLYCHKSCFDNNLIEVD